MQMNDKRCVQCGILKQPKAFRPYTHSKGKPAQQVARYRICRECEALNAKYRRAQERGDWDEFERLNDLFKALEELGFRTPRSAKSPSDTATMDAIARIKAHHGVSVDTRVSRDPEPKPEPKEKEIVELFTFGDDEPYMAIEVEKPEPVLKAHYIEEVPELRVPSELQHWLDVDPAEWDAADLSPEYLQETVYESLKAKYRPQTGVNRDTYIPIYDNTYRAVLNEILRKFDDYEEEMSQRDYIEEVVEYDTRENNADEDQQD